MKKKNGITKDKNGAKEWRQNGQLHRIDGPAIEYANGDKEWWICGIRCEEAAKKKATKHYDLYNDGSTIISVTLSTTKPRGWFSVNKKNDFEEHRYLSVEKHINLKTAFKQYLLCVGPACLIVGHKHR